MIHLFTHTDLDGVGCAILARLAFKNNFEITYCDYKDINEKISDFIKNPPEQGMCLMTDISINEDLAKKIDEIEESDITYKLLDHHPTAMNLSKYFWCDVKIMNESGIKTCGTELFYEWLLYFNFLEENKTIRKFVDIVRDYDTWRWAELGDKGTVCKKVNDLYYLYGKDRFINWCIEGINENTFPEFKEMETFILQMKQDEIDRYVEEKNKTLFCKEIQNYQCGIVFADHNFSELGNRLAKMHQELDIIIMIDMDGTVSYRTVKEDVNLGEFAKAYGGGGHPKAAGSQFDRVKICNEIFGLLGY